MTTSINDPSDVSWKASFLLGLVGFQDRNFCWTSGDPHVLPEGCCCRGTNRAPLESPEVPLVVVSVSLHGPLSPTFQTSKNRRGSRLRFRVLGSRASDWALKISTTCRTSFRASRKTSTWANLESLGLG